MQNMLESARIRLVPLTLTQLKLQVNNPTSFVKALGYPDRLPDEAPPALNSALVKMAQAIEETPTFWPWNTNWAIILKRDQVYVGGIDFHGAPDVEGQVEIGYGLDAAYRHRGLMVDALFLMVGWAFSHPEVRVVKAETAYANLPSQRVLQRAGFCPFFYDENNLWWRVERSSWCAGGGQQHGDLS